MQKKLSIFLLSSIMVFMLAACGSSNKAPALEETPNVKEEVSSTTGQIDNSSDDSSVESTPTPEVTPTEEPTSTPTPEPTETPTPEPTPEPTETPEVTPSVVPDEKEDEKKEPNDGSNTAPTTKDEESTSKEPTTTPTQTPTQTPTTTPTVPDNSSSSSNVVVVPPEEDDPTPTPTPTPNPTPTPTPSTPSGWNGNYDELPSGRFEDIKVPTIDKFYDEGLSNKDGAFDFGSHDKAWEDAWYESYEDFLIAGGNPVDDQGNVYGAFSAIHDGFVDGYQYLYYGFSQGATNGWGDIVVYNNGMHPTISGDSNYNGSYILEFSNFTFGNMDKNSEDEYRAATTMLLSWIVPNPSQVEKEIYEAFTTNTSKIENHLVQNGFGTWMQIGDVDICVSKIDSKEETYMFALREHR